MITDLEARKLASEWHGGQMTCLYAFSSSGAIESLDRLMDEVADNISQEVQFPEEDSQTRIRALNALLGYIIETGQRGPVEGWGNLIW